MAINCDQLTVNYDKTPALYNASFHIPKGVMAAIIGPNGSGKSTLLKSCLGLIKPLSGSVSFETNKIVYVPQQSEIDWNFPITAFEFVLMGCYGDLGLFKWPKKIDKERAMLSLEALGLKQFAQRQIGAFSGGERQRLFLARAKMQGGDIFFLDEPFAGIDAAAEERVVAFLKELTEDGKTVVVVHHDLISAPKYFDWFVLLKRSVIAFGPLDTTFTFENISKTYQTTTPLLEEVIRLARQAHYGEQSK